MPADQDEAAARLLDGLDLDALLAASARTRPADPALRDPPGRRAWSDEAPGSLSFFQFDERVDRLARLLTLNHAQPGAAVAIMAPLGTDAVVSLLAVLRAGLSPLLLPVHAGEAALAQAIEASGAVMALGSGRIGPARPLLTLRGLAARALGIRFVGGFGADIPDGIARLDALLAGADRQPLRPGPARQGIDVLDMRDFSGPQRIAERALLGHALAISRLLKPTAASRLVTALVGTDLAALASGPAMALMTGVELLPLGLFSLGDLQACLEGGKAVHLVLPGAMEPALARSRLAEHPALASLVFVHREDRALPALERPDIAIVDIEVRSAVSIAASRR